MDTWFKTAEQFRKPYSKTMVLVLETSSQDKWLQEWLKLEVEDTVYQIFTKKMSVRTNEEIILPVMNAVASAFHYRFRTFY